MKFSLKMESDNDDNGPDMVAAVLTRTATFVLDGHTGGPVLDRNGNTVGDWEMSES